MHKILLGLLVLVASATNVANADDDVPDTTVKGGCLVVVSQRGPVDIDQLPCDLYPSSVNGVRMQDNYVWLPPALDSAYDAAMSLMCSNSSNCSLDNGGRVVLLADGMLNAAGNSDGSIILIDAGLVDFVEASTYVLLKALRAGTTSPLRGGLGIDEWFEAMDAEGGQQCHWATVPPGAQLEIDQFEQLRLLAQRVYVFIMSHELSHVALGPTCGTSGHDELKQESACDAAAFSAISAKMPDDVPRLSIAVVTWMVAMSHYQAVRSPALLHVLHQWTSRSFSEVFTGANWRARAQRLEALTEAFCNTHSCEGIDAILKFETFLTHLPLPSECDDSNGVDTTWTPLSRSAGKQLSSTSGAATTRSDAAAGGPSTPTRVSSLEEALRFYLDNASSPESLLSVPHVKIAATDDRGGHCGPASWDDRHVSFTITCYSVGLDDYAHLVKRFDDIVANVEPRLKRDGWTPFNSDEDKASWEPTRLPDQEYVGFAAITRTTSAWLRLDVIGQHLSRYNVRFELNVHPKPSGSSDKAGPAN